MRMRRVRTLWVAIALAASGPASLAGAAEPDPARAAIEKLSVTFAEAFNRGDMLAVGALYDEEAIALPPDGPMVRGRPAIEAFWQGARDSGVKHVSLAVESIEPHGTLAVEVGTATLKIQPADQPEVSQNVKYVVVWKRQKDGAWKLYRDIWNGLPAPAQ